MFAATTSAFRYICSCARMPRCQSREEEAAFLHQHQEWLVHGTVVLITVGILGFAGVCTQDLQLEQARPEQPFAWELPDARFPTFIFRIIIIFVGVFAVSCICTTKSMQPEWATLVAEYTFAALSILTAVGGTLLNAWRGPALQGVDPRESWVQDAESSEIISIARMFTMIVVISVLPLRCSTVLVHHLIVAVSTVIIRVSFPGPFRGTDTWINMMVTVVVGFSFTGMYRLESFTRQSWMAMRTSQATVEVTQSALERQQATFDVIRSVLRVLFDVVLQMGETLTVTAENCNFSGVSPNAVDRGVFGEVDNSALTGVRLPDLLVPEDRDRLWTLAHNASTLNVPQLMTGTLLNSGGERIQHAVEIVMADTNLDGGQKYLVGIRFPPLPLDNEVDPVPDDFRDQARQNESRTLQAVPSTGRRRRRRGRDMMIQDAYSYGSVALPHVCHPYSVSGVFANCQPSMQMMVMPTLRWGLLFTTARCSAAFEIAEYGTSGEHPRCLDEDEAAFPRFAADVKLEPVLLAQKTWLSHCLNTQVTRIILEELLGQQTVYVDMWGRFSWYVYEDTACRSQGADCPEPQWQFDVDSENWHVWPLTERHRQYVHIDGTVLVAALGFSGRSGIFFAPHDAAPNPWDSWDYYKRHLDDSVLAQFPRAGTVDVLDVFDNNTDSDTYCGEAWNSRYPISTGPVWCVDGRYVPPVCQANLASCAEMYHANIGWDQGHIEQMIRNLNLKYVVSYITPKFEEILRDMTKTRPVVYSYYEPAPLNAVLKAQRIQFPPFLSGCFDEFIVTPDGPVTCDFRETVIYKVMASQLRRSNSLALSVLHKIRMSKANIDKMIASHRDADLDGRGQDCFNVSCNFVKENLQTIRTWLPACAPGEQWLADELQCAKKCSPDRVGQNCRKCPPGSVPNEQQTDCTSCPRGHFVEPTSGALQCLFCEPGTFQDKVGQTACEQCPVGKATKYHGSTSCSLCGAQGGLVFYAPKAGLSDCVPCPTGAICPFDENGTRVQHVALPGWYLAPSTSGASSSVDNGHEQLYKCPHSDPELGNACLGRNRCIEVDGQVSMEGIFCGKCRPGFQRYDEGGICFPCPQARSKLAMWIVFGVLIVVLVVALQVFFHVTMDFGQPKKVHVVIVKQFFNYAQLLGVVLGVNNLRLFDFGAVMVWAHAIASPPAITSFSLDCLYMFGNRQPTQYDRVVWAFFEPFVFLCVVNLGYITIAKIRTRSWRAPMDWSNCVPVSIICLFVIHPRLNAIFCRTFSCIVADEPRLFSDLSARCDSVDHGYWQRLAAAGVAIYSLGIPLMFFIVLFRSRRFLHCVHYKRLYGFLYNGFEPRFYYFEVVFMLRRVLFQVVAVLPGMYTNTQDEGKSVAHLIALLIVSGGFLCFHVVYLPFDDRANFTLDNLETSMLRAITGTVLLNLLARGTDSTNVFQDESARKTRDAVFFIIMVALHLYFLAHVLFGFFRRPLLRLLDRAQGTPVAMLFKSAGWRWEGYVVYEGDRLDLSDLTNKDRDMLSLTISDMLRRRIGRQQKLHSADLFDSIGYCCTEARLMRDKVALAQRKSSETGRIPKLFAGTGSTENEEVQRNVSSFTRSASLAVHNAVERIFSLVEVPTPAEYSSPANITDTEGGQFRIEELQVSLMRMHASKQLEETKQTENNMLPQIAVAAGRDYRAEESAPAPVIISDGTSSSPSRPSCSYPVEIGSELEEPEQPCERWDLESHIPSEDLFSEAARTLQIAEADERLPARARPTSIGSATKRLDT